MKPFEPILPVLAEARRILVFTGAGISTGSGIRDYRGPQGVWKERRPVTFDEFLASEEARVEYWDFKLEGWPSIRDAKPNVVHETCVALQEAGRLGCVVTQNVDGLHAAAGTSRENLVEIHGTDRTVTCLTCGEQHDPDPCYRSFEATRVPPRCDCGGVLKPATVSFGQALDEFELDRAFRAADEADLVFSLGSTLAVEPAASIPLRAASRRGVPYVIINRGETAHDNIGGAVYRAVGDVSKTFPAAVASVL